MNPLTKTKPMPALIAYKLTQKESLILFNIEVHLRDEAYSCIREI